VQQLEADRGHAHSIYVPSLLQKRRNNEHLLSLGAIGERRSVLRHIRVASKRELKERIMAGIEDVNRHPVIRTWSYKLAEARMI
jgi:hypothetical protein